jgi:cytochrome c-type biogenesis protein CcmH
MIWLATLALALASFAIAAFTLHLPRQTWTTVLAALLLGLAGYATQASPNLPGAPRPPRAASAQSDWPLIAERQAFVAESRRSTNERLLVADALARRGQFANSAAMLRAAVRDNPRDAESWLALAIVLVEHADGNMTTPALLAFRRASEADPAALGPGYFMGITLMRQGRFGEGREVWQATLDNAPADAWGRAQLEQRLAGLDELLREVVQARDAAPSDSPEATPAPQ